MKTLFNGCYRSEVSVTPKNWNTRKASLSRPWRIFYRFYDPAFKNDPKRWGKMESIKGMNRFASLEERQEATRLLLDNELDLLDRQGYNPITKQFMAPNADSQKEISPQTPFIDALKMAYHRLDVIKDTGVDIEAVIRGVQKACAALFDNRLQVAYSALPVCEVSRRHLKYILDYCAENNPRWSASRHNKYKAYLSMLFRELVQVEATESNPTRDIPCKKNTHKIKDVLTPEEFNTICEALKRDRYHFYRYIKIFFHSGSRTTELLSLRKNADIRIDQQEFVVLVKKGKYYRQDIRVISDQVKHLWEEIWNEAKPGEYLFSKFLRPGPVKIRKDQVGRRWSKYVKADPESGGLGIDKDFYSLKHLHTDAIAAALDIQHAAAADGHTTPVITLKHYAVNEKRRQLERIKGLKLGF